MKPRVFIVCPGVGHINRGYESFTVECFTALKNTTAFDLYLLKGAGKAGERELTIACIKRNGTLAKVFSKVTGKEPYWIEQFTFLIGMFPALIRHKPTLIYYSDFILGTFLWNSRKLFGFNYKLLFSNGAPNSPPFTRMDHVQQLLSVYQDSAVKSGAPAEIQTLLPYGFGIDVKKRLEELSKQEEVRSRLGFSKNQKVVLSVGAVNLHHKRMDYIVDEMSLLPDNYFLVILGQFEKETSGILEQAERKIPGRFLITSLPYEQVKDYYIAADYFVLASLTEGFGRVLVEAASYGLQCIVHDYAAAKEVLGNSGVYLNMKLLGELSVFLRSNSIERDKQQIVEYAYHNYSWDALQGKYVQMISRLLI